MYALLYNMMKVSKSMQWKIYCCILFDTFVNDFKIVVISVLHPMVSFLIIKTSIG